MASRRKGFPHRQLRQSNLIDSLSRCDKKEEDSANKPTVIDLEDSDPYKYVNSQSLEVSVVKNDPVRVPKTQGGSSPTTITMNTTPVQLQVSKAKRTKNKKSPAALTEEERLELREEEDLKRALEASRQDMERAGRKRKRDKLLAAREEQSAKYEDMQKRVEKTMEVVNMARNLDGNSVLALTTRPSSGPSGEMVCDDPPSFIPSPQSSSIAALEGIVRQSGGSPTTMAYQSEQDSTTSTRRVHITPPMPVPTVQIPPSQQLKEVRVKKLNLKKYSINPVKPAAHDTLSSGPTERVKPHIEGRELSGSCRKDSINIKTPVASQSGTGETRHSPTHEGELKEGSATPLLSKSTRQAHQRETAAASIKRTPAGVGWDDSATPPLPSVSAKGQVCSSKLPGSDCTEISSEELTRPLRRNLSLSYNKKHSTQRWQSSDKKAISVDETIIMSTTSESGGPSLVSSTPPGKASKLSSKSGSRSISLSLRRGPGDVLAKAGEGDTTKEGTRTTLLVGDGEVCSGGSEGEDVDNVSGDSSQPQSEQQSTCMELCVSQSESAPPRGTAMEAAAVSPHPKVDVRDSHVLPTVQGATAHPRMDVSDSHVLPTVQGVAAVSPHPRVDVRASPGLGVTARPAVQGSRDTMKRPSSSSQSRAPKRIKLHKSKEVKKDDTPLKDSRLHPPPPPLYAHKGVSPAEYSKVILNSFNSYFSQLAKAQSAVLCRLNWGKPIKSCVKQPTDSLFFSSRKTRSNSRWLNSHLRYSLKLNPRTDSNNEAASETAAQDQFSLDSFASEDDEIDFDYDTEDKIVDYTGETGLSGAGTHQVPPPTVREKEASRYTLHEPILIGTQEVGVGLGEDGSNGDGLSPGHEAILVGTQEVGVGLGEDGSNGDSLSPGHEAILVGTQDEFGAMEEKSMGHMDRTNTASLPHNFTPSPLSSDAELGMTGTPEKQSPWLSSRKPPPSAKKTLKPKRTTKRSKKTNSSGTKVTEKCSRQSRRRGRGGGKGSAAARLICSKQSTREESDQDQSSESDLGSDTPARFSQRRKRVSRLCTDSSEGSAEEDSLRERNPRPSRLTGSARNTGKSGLSPSRSGPNVIDLTEDLHRSTSTSTASHLKHACPICTQMFAESEIELHVDECIKAKDRYGRSGRGRSRCPTCNKMFESSLVGLHTEQCCGDGESEEEEEELPVIRRKRGVASGSRGKRLSMPVSPSPEPALSPDAEDDVVEIAGCEIDDPPSPHPPSPMDASATGSRVHGENPDDIYEREQPHYEDDPSTISTSPIRSFMRINDLDPAQRALLQNQFQTKGKGRRSGNRQLSFQHGNGWAGRDDFDELMDLGHSSGGQQGRYQNKKNWGNKKNYKNWNTSKFKRRPKRK